MTTTITPEHLAAAMLKIDQRDPQIRAIIANPAVTDEIDGCTRAMASAMTHPVDNHGADYAKMYSLMAHGVEIGLALALTPPGGESGG